MRKQFIYTAVIAKKEFKASLNINKVIRSLTNEDGSIIVILIISMRELQINQTLI